MNEIEIDLNDPLPVHAVWQVTFDQPQVTFDRQGEICVIPAGTSNPCDVWPNNQIIKLTDGRKIRHWRGVACFAPRVDAEDAKPHAWSGDRSPIK
jgi:hypothetical protein